MHGQRAELQPAALLLELPRRGAGGGTCTSDHRGLQPRAFATRPRQRAQGPGLEPGIFGFRSRRVTDSTIPVLAVHLWEWPPHAATPLRSVRAPHTITARTTNSPACARIDTCSIAALFPSWVFSCQRAWAIATDQLIGGKSQSGQKKKGLATRQTFAKAVDGRGLPVDISCHLRSLASQTWITSPDERMGIQGDPALASGCFRSHGCLQADGLVRHAASVAELVERFKYSLTFRATCDENPHHRRRTCSTSSPRFLTTARRPAVPLHASHTATSASPRT